MNIEKKVLLNLTSPAFREEEGADLVITIDQLPTLNGGYCYTYFLESRQDLRLNLNHVKCQSEEIDDKADKRIKEIFGLINNELKRSDFDSSSLNHQLVEIGINLYKQVVGYQFNDLYWKKIHGKVKTIQLITDNKHFFPWELLYPSDLNDKKRVEKGFLCEIYNIARWLRGPDFKSQVKVVNLGLVNTESQDLSSATEESQEIKNLFKKRIIDITCSKSEIQKCLRDESQISAIHFIGHGVSNQSNLSYIKLSNGEKFDVFSVPHDTKPGLFIFLNACETGLIDRSLSYLSGWAAKFIQELDGSAFIGSMWKVRDESAYNFAKSFYEKLLEGKTFGEAAREARKSNTINEHPSSSEEERTNACSRGDKSVDSIDPSALSYIIYANPLARLALDDSPNMLG